MIAFLRGTVLEKGGGRVVVEAGGVGYEVFVSESTLRRVGPAGEPAELFVSESSPLYGGGTTLYGFLSKDEKEVFLTLKEHVPSTGAKKALEHLDKASRSLPDFRRAILEGDARILAGVFGFTRKTADKLVASLKDKLGEAAGVPPRGAAAGEAPRTRSMQQALDALIALGYTPNESRQALASLTPGLQGREPKIEEIIRLALKQL